MNASSLRILVFSALAALSAGPLSAAVLTLTPSADNVIRADQPTNNFNTGPLLVLGDTGTAALRNVFAFDLSAHSELAGATINSVTLTLTIFDRDGTSANENVTVELRQLNRAFTGSGVNWNVSSTGNNWDTPGGDFGSVIASITANAGTNNNDDTLDLSGLGLADATTNAVGGTLYLIAKLSDEAGDRNVFRVVSSDSTSGTHGTAFPTLTIDYTATVIPEPAGFALLGGVAILGFAGFRRRR